MGQPIRDEVIEELLHGYTTPQDLLGEEGLFKELKKRLLEWALGAELTEHLGYDKGDPAGRGSGNSRNGYSSKTVISDDGAIEIAVPRDRQGSFAPQIVAKSLPRRRPGARPASTSSTIASSAFTPAGCWSARSRPTCRRWTGSRFRPTPSSAGAGSDQPGHRCGARGGPGVAEPTSRPALPGAFLRRAAGQDP